MKSELLAPAGSCESMKAAYAAGADAVYIGGSRFGARAYADNPDDEMLKKAVDYAHIRGKKLYLTVNTLLKDEEMADLYEYLAPLYKEGLDAVIVQDFGVLKMIRACFPQMEIHASTQMSITTEYGARLLKESGASRIVTARELSLEEIRTIHENTDIEIESFIHGALCYCYSGQCLLSSMLGGRSGNRGRCAQPCRLPYETEGFRKEKGKYLLSPKDICTLDILPEILECGVYSLKIEGRMKKAEYTAGVVSVYRKYLDLYAEKGREGYSVSKEDRTVLLDLYNRGGFSTGYYKQHNGPGMMSVKRPNHQGIKAARIVSSGPQGLKIEAMETLHKGDVLEKQDSQDKQGIVLDTDIASGKKASVKWGGKYRNAENGSFLMRTRNQQLIDFLEKNYLAYEYCEKINGKLILSKQKPAILKLTCRNFEISAEGACPKEAKNRPLTLEDVEKQMKKTGGSGFVFEDMKIEMEDGLFMPLQGLNELRRSAVAKLQETILAAHRRKDANRPAQRHDAFQAEDECGGVLRPEQEMPFPAENDGSAAPLLSVSLENTAAFEEICRMAGVDAVYLDCNAFYDREDFVLRGSVLASMCREAGKRCFYIMPWIFRSEAVEYYSKEDVWRTLLCFDGVLLRSQDEYLFLRGRGYGKSMAADWNLYTWNAYAEDFWREKGLCYDTLPPELNRREIMRRGCKGSELIVYGHQPLMVSAQCQIKNRQGCTKKPQLLSLTDRKRKRFSVKNNCQFCYNTIYNGIVTELADCREDIARLKPRGIRLMFTTEDERTVLSVIRRYAAVFKEGQAAGKLSGEFTRGHFERKVE